MGSLPYRSQPLPTDNVQAPDVATASNVQFRRLSQSQKTGGGGIGARRILTSDTFISSTDSLVLVDTTAAGVTLRLPKATEYPTMQVQIQRLVGANTLTIVPRGTDTIDGAASLVVTATVTLTPQDNATWHVFNTSA